MVVENTGETGTAAVETTGGQDVPRETAAVETPVEVTPPADGAPPVETEWAPSFKFKVHDDEREFDDWLKPYVKSKEDEDRIKDLLERAHGLDFVKQDRTTLREHNRALMETTQEFESVKGELQKMGAFLREGDFESFRESFNIPEQVVLDWALHRVKLANATPEEQAAYVAQRQEQQRLRELEESNNNWQQSYQQYVAQQKETELSYVLTSPDIAPIAKDFDARMGREGAFRAEVIRRGQLHFQATQQDLTAKQAVDSLLAMLGVSPGQVANPPAVPQGHGGQTPQTRQAKPVIPHIAGSGASPVKKIPKRIADLRQLAQNI